MMKSAGSLLSLPHGRGDVSGLVIKGEPAVLSSPRAWGCFFSRGLCLNCNKVFPTGVGMFLFPGPLSQLQQSLPHGRGDVSIRRQPVKIFSRSSPRAWGCFLTTGRSANTRRVFPTGVGMFPALALARFMIICLPHGRRDVSQGIAANSAAIASSPRAWGCFRRARTPRTCTAVFPTGVGMFPCNQPLRFSKARFPHGCGDVSDIAR